MIYLYIDDLIIDIKHVGSTSVPGLSAKPVIDMNIIIESCEVFSKLMEKLEIQAVVLPYLLMHYFI
jgi:GrpB-like predicted nucleotidyltransferase (UPF0157 family)